MKTQEKERIIEKILTSITNPKIVRDAELELDRARESFCPENIADINGDRSIQIMGSFYQHVKSRICWVGGFPLFEVPKDSSQAYMKMHEMLRQIYPGDAIEAFEISQKRGIREVLNKIISHQKEQALKYYAFHIVCEFLPSNEEMAKEVVEYYVDRYMSDSEVNEVTTMMDRWDLSPVQRLTKYLEQHIKFKDAIRSLLASKETG